MITRNEALTKAAEDCMKEMYSYAQPHVEWNDFVQQNKEYAEKYQQWKNNENKQNNKIDSIGVPPYEFYYLPTDIMKDICDSYVNAYKINTQQEFLDNIEVIKNYCNEPIVETYVKEENSQHGHRTYQHPKNLITQLKDIFKEYDCSIVSESMAEDAYNKFFEFLDMAANFYQWNRDLNAFNLTVYLGASPNSNKEKVIENWKKYKNVNIEINEEDIKKNYFGEDYEEENT